MGGRAPGISFVQGSQMVRGASDYGVVAMHSRLTRAPS